jgi:hypothetical protein
MFTTEESTGLNKGICGLVTPLNSMRVQDGKASNTMANSLGVMGIL